jgi:hypothetical protein
MILMCFFMEVLLMIIGKTGGKQVPFFDEQKACEK